MTTIQVSMPASANTGHGMGRRLVALRWATGLCVVMGGGAVLSAGPDLPPMTAGPSIGQSPLMSPGGPSGQSYVRVSDGLISMSVRGMSLKEVLEAIGRETGIHVSIHGSDATTPVSQVMTARPLAEGLAVLLNGRNYVLLYQGVGADKHLTQIILGAGGSVASPSSPPVRSYAPPPMESREPVEPGDPESPRSYGRDLETLPPGSPQGLLPPLMPPTRPPQGQSTIPTVPPPAAEPEAVAPAEATPQAQSAPPTRPSPWSAFPYLNAIQRQAEARAMPKDAAGLPAPPETPPASSSSGPTSR